MRTKIIFEDESILVCHKPAGMAVETKDLKQKDCVSELKNYLAKQNPSENKPPYLAVIHRLDQPVEGVIVFGKTKSAAAELSRQMKNKEMGKYYLAAVYGKVTKNGELSDLLYKDGKTNTSRTVMDNEIETLGKENVKEAHLSYEVLTTRKEENQDITILKIKLGTGRHHQIRVQCANAGFPLLGDMKYGSTESQNLSEDMFLDTVQLISYELHFNHPVTKEKKKYQLSKVSNIFRLS